MTKYKCIKLECPQCHNTGSIQLFINKNGAVTYARTRHYQHTSKDSHKPQFTYCKIINLEELKTLLPKQEITLSVNNPEIGQASQSSNLKIHDLKLKHPGSIQTTRSGRSLVWQDISLPRSKNIDPQQNNENFNAKFRRFLEAKYAPQYASLLYSYSVKYSRCINNPTELLAIPASTRSNVLKAMLALSAYQGAKEDYHNKLKQYGIHWTNNNDSFNSFLRIINNNHSNLPEWYKTAQKILNDNEKLWLRFNLLSGLRKEESINSFNLVIQLSRENKLAEYYNEELEVLEHFKYGQLFLRGTKNCYITILNKELLHQIADSQPVSYSAIRKRLSRNRQKMRIKELRSYYATFMRKHGILAEFVDLLQGRIPKSVFARHYLKIEDLKELVSQVNAVISTMESSIKTSAEKTLLAG